MYGSVVNIIFQFDFRICIVASKLQNGGFAYCNLHLLTITNN